MFRYLFAARCRDSPKNIGSRSESLTFPPRNSNFRTTAISAEQLLIIEQNSLSLKILPKRMSSRSLLECQEDFVLAISDSHKMMQAVSNNELGGSNRSLKSEMVQCDDQDDSYVPVNDIKPEVYAMIAAWKSHQLDRQHLEIDASMPDLPAESSVVNFEPDRNCALTGPPKRFYRTFWRSISLRSLQRSRDLLISDIRERFLQQ